MNIFITNNSGRRGIIYIKIIRSIIYLLYIPVSVTNRGGSYMNSRGGGGGEENQELRMKSKEYKPLDDSWTWLGLRQLVNLIKLASISHLPKQIYRQIDYDKVLDSEIDIGIGQQRFFCFVYFKSNKSCQKTKNICRIQLLIKI